MYFSTISLYCIFLDDVSYKKVATQSHTTLGKETDASYAVDRNTETCMKTLPIGISSPEKTVWWKVDLSEVYSIQSINLLFKNYNGYGMLFVCLFVFIDFFLHKNAIKSFSTVVLNE